jgi:4-amino-4-deoxy-L-arabinose transferase-like glycosyltransferase
MLGLFGHDPWKPDDASTFGVVFDIIQGGHWPVLHVAGVSVAERPPLFYLLAATTADGLDIILPLHDGARVANALCLGFALWLLAVTGRELYGRAFRWLPVLIFIGCIGLWDRAHQLSPDIGLLPSYALALYGMALAPRRPGMAGALLGLAAGLAFLFRGFVGAALIALTALALPIFATWRTRRYVGTIALALIVAAPLIAAWPLLLYMREPAAFAQWASAQDLGRFFGRGLGSPPIEPFYYAKNLPWVAWPALPLALWTLWIRGRGFNGGLRSPGVQLPATMALIVLCVLSAAAEPRASLILPILLPLSLLGAAEVDTLKRGFSGALDWFGILTFGLLGIVFWALWLDSLLQGLPESVAQTFRDTQPGFRPPFDILALIVSAVLTLLWLTLVRPARRSNRRTVLNWAAGMTLVWGLYMTIWLPYLDSRRSYRPVAESLAAALPRDTCVTSRNLGEPQSALLEYFIGLVTVREETKPDNDCKALLLQAGRNEPDFPPDSAWEKIWEGHRRGDDTERFILFRRPVESRS